MLVFVLGVLVFLLLFVLLIFLPLLAVFACSQDCKRLLYSANGLINCMCTGDVLLPKYTAV